MSFRFFLRYTIILILSIGFVLSCSSDDEIVVEPTAPPTNVDRSANQRQLGEAANDILSADTYRSLTLEIVSVAGFEPDQESVDQLVAFIKERTFKPDGVEVRKRTIATSDLDSLTIEQVAEIEFDNRMEFNSDDNLAIYVYFADKDSDETSDEGIVLGSAYLNTSMVIYQKTLQDLARKAQGRLPLPIIESATLQHEFAHLMGLVNVGTDPVNPEHEDQAAEGHCNVDNCLMLAVVEFGNPDSMMEMLENDGIPNLDEECIRDLRANGGR